jgi:CheY-like chemotaxis protein
MPEGQLDVARRSGESSPPLILIVDDAPVELHLAGMLLEKDLGSRVAFAGHGREALAAIKTEMPALIVTDLLMPEMDGLQLVEEVRARFPTLPIVLMTAHGNEELALRALEAGAASYVPKRTLAKVLAPTVERILSAARQERRRNYVLECISRLEADFEIENDPALVPHLIAHVQEQMLRMKLCNENTKIRIGVALEEALLNGLYHGNLEVSSELRQDGSNRYEELAGERRGLAPYRDRRLHVQVRLSMREASFVIRDEGPGFDLTQLLDPTDPENMLRTSGRGLLLIRTFMDEVIHNAAGNQITMVKRAQG